jgi:hypothetical protein
MPYSAVTQPWFSSRSQRGWRSSMLAVQITLVFPKATSTEPSACMVKFGVKDIGRI